MTGQELTVETDLLPRHETAAPDAAVAHAPPAQRLRVLVFTTVFPNPALPLHGTFVFERVRHLAALADIRVVAPVPWYRAFAGRRPSAQVGAIVATRHPIFWYLPKVLMPLRGLCLFLSTVTAIARLRRSFDFDLIDAHFAYPDGFAAILLGRWFRRPVCITLRGTIIMLSRRPLGRLLCDWAIRRADRIIAVARTLAERASSGGVPPERIETIANSVDTHRFRVLDRGSARRQLGLSQDRPLLVSVGHLSPRKGFHRIIRALPHLIGRDPRVHLAIVGGKGAEGDNAAELASLARGLGVTEHVAFVGARPPEDVALWLGAASAFVLASDFEGCPNVVLEAMACGRPIVATRVGDIDRMVPPFAGVLLDNPEDSTGLADAIAAALARDWDPERIRAHVAARSWDDVAQRVTVQWRLALASFSAAHGAAAEQPSAALDRRSAGCR